jgi:hypothetical protein
VRWKVTVQPIGTLNFENTIIGSMFGVIRQGKQQ